MALETQNAQKMPLQLVVGAGGEGGPGVIPQISGGGWRRGWRDRATMSGGPTERLTQKTKKPSHPAGIKKKIKRQTTSPATTTAGLPSTHSALRWRVRGIRRVHRGVSDRGAPSTAMAPPLTKSAAAPRA